MTNVQAADRYFREDDPLRHEVIGASLARLAEQAHSLLAFEPWHGSKRELATINGAEKRLPARMRRAVRRYNNHWEYGTDATEPLATPTVREGARIYGRLGLQLTETEFFHRRWFGRPGALALSTLDVRLDFPQHTYRRGSDEHTPLGAQADLRPYRKPDAHLEVCYDSGYICAINVQGEDVLQLAKGVRRYDSLATYIGRLSTYIDIATPWVPRNAGGAIRP